MSDEIAVRDEDEDDGVLEDEDEEVLDVVAQPLIVPELDLQGGTVFKVGDEEYASMAEAVEATKPEEPEVEEQPVEEQPDE